VRPSSVDKSFCWDFCDVLIHVRQKTEHDEDDNMIPSRSRRDARSSEPALPRNHCAATQLSYEGTEISHNIFKTKSLTCEKKSAITQWNILMITPGQTPLTWRPISFPLQ
jgi:hypothetical protein